MKRPYQAPTLVQIGTVQQLTMQFKNTSGADGVIFQPGNIPIGSA